MTPCRLIQDGPQEGGWNMAVDEALLESAAAGQTTIRFYGWSEPTLSIGYFQSHQDRKHHAASRACPLVRRASGGGAILHHHELTYSFATPASARLARDQSRFYEGFHQTLVEVLRRWGGRAAVCSAPAAKNQQEPPFLCFQRHTAGDVLAGPHKIAGSAQRRYRSALLQHGSVLLSRSPFAAELPGIEQRMPVRLSPDELAAEWLAAITQLWSLEVVPGTLSTIERERAVHVRNRKYSRTSWTHRR